MNTSLQGHWEDMGLYWAWRGARLPRSDPRSKPPTSKLVDYAMTFASGGKRTIAIGVWDDNVYRPLNRDEYAKYHRESVEIFIQKAAAAAVFTGGLWSLYLVLEVLLRHWGLL